MSTQISVPFLRPSLGEEEISEVLDTLRSGWLTSGPKVKRFESEFAAAVNAKHAVALNSCTAALHLAVEALDLQPGDGVLVPTMTFAATAEIIRYVGGIPILVDCDPVTHNMDLDDAELKLQLVASGKLKAFVPPRSRVVGMIPVHVGGLMMNVEAIQRFANRHNLWVVEDAAHAFPAAWRRDSQSKWTQCGEQTAKVSCFSFYANKTITTGEGGMATTDDSVVADRIRLMSLHGLSHDAWGRYSGGNSWDYRIVAPGFKYNLTDIAASLGIQQLVRAEPMRREREAIAHRFLRQLAAVDEIELPLTDNNRIHSWHLFPIRLQLQSLSIDRNGFMTELKAAGVGCSVHWRPLHLHPYYQQKLGWCSDEFPVATAEWLRLISLPIFPGMTDAEVAHVIDVVQNVCAKHSVAGVLTA